MLLLDSFLIYKIYILDVRTPQPNQDFEVKNTRQVICAHKVVQHRASLKVQKVHIILILKVQKGCTKVNIPISSQYSKVTTWCTGNFWAVISQSVAACYHLTLSYFSSSKRSDKGQCWTCLRFYNTNACNSWQVRSITFSNSHNGNVELLWDFCIENISVKLQHGASHSVMQRISL